MPTNELSTKPSHVLSTVLKPVGIENLGNTCYLSTLLPQHPDPDHILGCTTEKEIDPEENIKKRPHYNQYFWWILSLTVKLHLTAKCLWKD